jgi:uncharacterized protein
MVKMEPVVHFEMPYANHERLMNFYSNVFGWQMQKLGGEMGDYVLAATTETDERGMVKTPGTINGGFFPKSGTPGVAAPSVVIAVENIHASMDKVLKAGGKVHDKPMEIPGIGQYVAITDTEGNRVGLLQPMMR